MPSPVVPPPAPTVSGPVTAAQLIEPAPAAQGCKQYRVRGPGETLKSIARTTLGSSERWVEVQRLNPTLSPDAVIGPGAEVRLPADAVVSDEEPLKPLPSVRTRMPVHRPKALLPLTGTFQVTLDDQRTLVLPREVREQLGGCEAVMVSPGTDKCLWLTNQAHLDRLGHRLEQSPAREADVRNFKRLYYAQAVRTPVKADERVSIGDRLAAFAGLGREVVLVGSDDHFELWDLARWRRYTQQRARIGINQD
jgi:MraZ protein